MREPAQQFLGRQHLDPWGGKLEGERECIEPPTNRASRWRRSRREAKARFDVSNPFDEESHRGRARQIRGRHRIHVQLQRQRSDGALRSPAHAQWGAAGGQHAEATATSVRRSATSGDASKHLLEIIEHQQRRLIAARDACALRQVRAH